MSEVVCHAMITSILNIFNKPDMRESARTQLVERCRPIPDAAARAIIEALGEMEQMPGNLGLAIEQAWGRWLARSAAANSNEPCGECGGTGYIFCWFQHEGSMRSRVSACPACRGGLPRETLEQQGRVCMPMGYPGGVARFVMDNGWMQ